MAKSPLARLAGGPAKAANLPKILFWVARSSPVLARAGPCRRYAARINSPLYPGLTPGANISFAPLGLVSQQGWAFFLAHICMASFSRSVPALGYDCDALRAEEWAGPGSSANLLSPARLPTLCEDLCRPYGTPTSFPTCTQRSAFGCTLG